MKKRKGFKTIIVNGKPYLMAWSLMHGTNSHPVLVIYTEDEKRFVFNSKDFDIPEKPEGRAPTWKGKHGTAGFDTYEANYIISKSGI